MHVFGSIPTLTESGLYCPDGGFHVDPWRPVPRAVVTHGHADHARRGSTSYLAPRRSLGVLRTRLGSDAPLEGMDWGEERRVGSVRVSFHPAGHTLGSAQIRLEKGGEVCVAAGNQVLEVAGSQLPSSSSSG